MNAEALYTYPMPAHGWTCFHCGETFTTPGAARDHFGATPESVAGCIIKAGEERGLLMALRVREAEAQALRQQLAEDSLTQEQYHQMIAVDLQQIKPFSACRSLRDVFNLFDSVEGRAIAAEERVRKLEVERRTPPPPRIVLNGDQARGLVDFCGGDFEVELELGMCDATTDQDTGEEMPAGLYVWLHGYPEEGRMPLPEKLEVPKVEINPVSDNRLLEIATNMKAHDLDLGPLDRQDIRDATLELFHQRRREDSHAKA